MLFANAIARSKRNIALRINEARFPYSPYMNKHQCVFIHIPKTGGTSIRLALGAARTGRAHLPWFIYHQANSVKFIDFFKLAFLRDPATRAYSAYTYLYGGGNRMDDHDAARLIRSYKGFSDFVENGLAKGFFSNHVLFLPQSFFVCDYAGHVKVDFLGRMENLDADANFALKKLGVAGVVPRENASVDTPSGESIIEPGSLDLLEHIYRADFALLRKIQESSLHD